MGLRVCKKESLIPCMTTLGKATMWEGEIGTLVDQADGDMVNNPMWETMARFLENNYFDSREVKGWPDDVDVVENVDPYEKKVARITKEAQFSTLFHMKEVMKKTTVDKEVMYNRKKDKIEWLVRTLKNIDRLGLCDQVFKSDDHMYTYEYKLAWTVGTIFQHRGFYMSEDDPDGFPSMCLLNQPKVNQRDEIDEKELWEVLKELFKDGTQEFQISSVLVAPYQVKKGASRDGTSSPVEPMVSIGANTNSKCYACPVELETLIGLFEVLTGVKMNGAEFRFLSGKLPLSGHQRINFALFAVLEAIKHVYGDLSSVEDYNDLFLVCHLNANDNDYSINLSSSVNEEPMTFPIGVRELVNQTALKFQAITRLRFSWGDGQTRQSAVTTYLCGKNPFQPYSEYRSKFVPEMYPDGFGEHVIWSNNYVLTTKVAFVPANMTIALIRHPYSLSVKGRGPFYTMSKAHGIARLREMSKQFEQSSVRGDERTYKQMFLKIAKQTDRSYLYPIAGNDNWVDHFFYKRWDLLGMVFDDNAGDLQRELIECKASKPRRVIPDPRNARNQEPEEENDLEANYTCEIDNFIRPNNRNIREIVKLAFQYYFLGRPNLAPRANFLLDLDQRLSEFEQSMSRYEETRRLISNPGRNRASNTIEEPVPSPIGNRSYIGHGSMALDHPLKYVGNPRKTPLPKCAWCIIGFFSECASGQPDTVHLAKEFVANNGRRSYRYRIVKDDVMGYNYPYDGMTYDEKVARFCERNKYCYLVSTRTSSKLYLIPN